MATSGSGVTGAADPFFGKHAAAPAPAPYYDPESLAEAEYAAAFADRGVRDGFVSRVLTIVCVQLVVTVAATAAMVRRAMMMRGSEGEWEAAAAADDSTGSAVGPLPTPSSPPSFSSPSSGPPPGRTWRPTSGPS